MHTADATKRFGASPFACMESLKAEKKVGKKWEKNGKIFRSGCAILVKTKTARGQGAIPGLLVIFALIVLFAGT